MSSTNISGLFLFSLRAVHRKIGICFMPEDALVQAALFTCPLLLVHQAGFVLSLMMYSLKRKLNCSQLISFAGNHKLSAEALYGGMVGASFATEQLLQLILTDASRHLRGFLVLDTERRIETVAKVRFSSLKLASLSLRTPRRKELVLDVPPIRLVALECVEDSLPLTLVVEVERTKA
ncbi:hypothetical protein KCV04_g42, partial [Aureobasidium melanogenum]